VKPGSRTLLRVACVAALGLVISLAVAQARSGAPGHLVILAPETAKQDADGDVRIEVQLRNDLGVPAEVMNVTGGLARNGKRACLEPLRIVSRIEAGEVVALPVETIHAIKPILPSDTCTLSLTLIVRREATLFTSEGYQAESLDVPLRIEP